MKDNQEYIYVAAGLFNADTNIYNAYLTKTLESLGYTCYLPQRDGFEVANFIKFLNQAKEEFDPKVASKVAHYVPYYLDIGYFMSRSIATVAVLDDPVDIGMVVEISYSKLCNIPVVGVRTDLRSPLGDVADKIGINPFPVQQCDCYIKASTPTGGYEEIMKETDAILAKVVGVLEKYIPRKKNNMKENENPNIKNIIKGSEILFADIDDFHDEESMKEMARRFVSNEKFFDSVAPEILSI